MQKNFIYFLNHKNKLLQEEAREMQLCHKMGKELNMEVNQILQIHHLSQIHF